jgi:hypothetical protein
MVATETLFRGSIRAVVEEEKLMIRPPSDIRRTTSRQHRTVSWC